MHIFALLSVEHDCIEVPQECRAPNNPEGESRHRLCLSEAQNRNNPPSGPWHCSRAGREFLYRADLYGSNIFHLFSVKGTGLGVSAAPPTLHISFISVSSFGFELWSCKLLWCPAALLLPGVMEGSAQVTEHTAPVEFPSPESAFPGHTRPAQGLFWTWARGRQQCQP